jgi:hypothetical protein
MRSSRKIQTYINKVIIIGVCAHMLDDHIREALSPDSVLSLRGIINVTSHDQLFLRVTVNREGYRPQQPPKPLSRRSQKVSTVAASF